MMRKEWVGIIDQIVVETDRELKESEKNKVLMNWRSKLAQVPHQLQLFQIDEIVREVRNRLTNSKVHAIA